jgi:hypothetical protein
MFFYAAAEQCAIRRGDELELADFARAAVLVAPGMCSVRAEVVVLDQPPPGHQPGKWPPRQLMRMSRSIRPVHDELWRSPSNATDEEAVAAAISRIPRPYFNFTSVSTSREWAALPSGVTRKMTVGGGIEFPDIYLPVRRLDP